LTKRITLLILWMALALSATTTVTLVGNNAFPGMLAMTVGGTSVEALDYTGQRFSFQGQTWEANILTMDQIASTGYYGPSDPIIQYEDYVARYIQWIYLFERLKTDVDPVSVAAIQNAVYYISGGPGFVYNSYVADAQAAVTNGYSPNTDSYRFINSPLSNNPLIQGFMYQVPLPTPEPGTLLMSFCGACLIVLAKLPKR